MIATIGRFFYLQTIAVFFERQAEPAPNSRTRLLQIETQRSRADRLPPAALVCGETGCREVEVKILTKPIRDLGPGSARLKMVLFIQLLDNQPHRTQRHRCQNNQAAV